MLTKYTVLLPWLSALLALGEALNIDKSNVLTSPPKGSSRNPRLFFGLFADVTPYACTGFESGSAGTCRTTDECEALGNIHDGVCYQQFSACCINEVSECGSTMYQDKGTIKTPGPGIETRNTFDGPGTCSYTVSKEEGFCQLQIEFVDVVLAEPVMGECGNDTLMITGDACPATPTLCGHLTGDPTMIINMVSVSSVDITFVIATDTSSWNLKVTQIPCASADLAPPGCLTYGTETSGTFKSYNYQAGGGQMINGQSYAHCIKYQPGFGDVALSDNGFDVGAGIFTVGSVQNTGSDFTSTMFNFTGPYAYHVMTPDENADMVAGYDISYEMLPCP
jgi:hypothetical protein